jgi:siroheme synthase-like protein
MIKEAVEHYPIFLSLAGKPVVVAGGGKVGLRKAKGLLEAGARVTVISPECAPEFNSLPAKLVRRRFRPADLEGACLVFAATNDRKVNQAVAAAARRRGIPVNVADAAGECDFIVPSRVSAGDLQLAVSTSGRSPRLAAQIRREFEAILRREAARLKRHAPSATPIR